MRQSAFKRLVTGAVLAVVLHATPAFSARVAGIVISGTVTSVTGGQIVINGATYSVQQTGSVLTQLQQVEVGQMVDVVLNGPAGAATTQVVSIHVRPAS